ESWARLKSDGFVQGAALRATGAVHVRVIRIDIGAIDAAEDVVVARCRTEPALTLLRVNREDGDRAQQPGNITQHYGLGSHIRIVRRSSWSPPLGACANGKSVCPRPADRCPCGLATPGATAGTALDLPLSARRGRLPSSQIPPGVCSTA